MTRSRHIIFEELARENARIAELARAQDEARAKIQFLHSELTEASSTDVPVLSARDYPRTAVDKVNLFRSLLRGRPDVFPVRFVSKKTGKRKPNGQLDVAMIQSLVRKECLDDVVASLWPGHSR